MKQFLVRCLTTSFLCSAMALSQSEFALGAESSKEARGSVTGSFSDVSTSAWYYDFVSDMALGAMYLGNRPRLMGLWTL